VRWADRRMRAAGRNGRQCHSVFTQRPAEVSAVRRESGSCVSCPGRRERGGDRGGQPASGGSACPPRSTRSARFSGTGCQQASTVQLSATREMTTDEAIPRARVRIRPAAVIRASRSGILLSRRLWAAIRAGWREGYNAEADHFIVSGGHFRTKSRDRWRREEAIHHARATPNSPPTPRACSCLEADTRHPQAWDDITVEDKFADCSRTTSAIGSWTSFPSASTPASSLSSFRRRRPPARGQFGQS